MDMSDLIFESKEIFDMAVTDYSPYAIVLLLSGGDDSLLALNICIESGIKIDYVIHGNTGTGLPETTEYVRELVKSVDAKYIEAGANGAYEKYVLRKGFFGKGVSAHSFSYHVLKVNPFNSAISKHIRQRKRGRKVLLLNGVRVDESENRLDNFGDNPIRLQPGRPNNIWVNIVHWWTTKQRDEYLLGNSINRNPVSKQLGRSGECMCGTMQTMADAHVACEFSPRWKDWWLNIRREVTSKFNWDWGQNMTKNLLPTTSEQLDMFMPMCVGCKSSYIKILTNQHGNKQKQGTE